MSERISWKPVKGYEGYYEVSNNGSVRSINRVIVRKDGEVRSYNGRTLKFSLSFGGYKQVVLMKNGVSKTFKIHRLVAISFIPNKKNYLCVNHINGIVLDNNTNNLEWCTHQYNTKHSYIKLGRIPVHGEKSNMAKLSLKQVHEIRKKYIPRKNSYRKIAEEYGVCESTIGYLIRGKNWRHD